MPALDQTESIREIDTDGMADVLKEFPARTEAAFTEPLPTFPIDVHELRSIAIVGLGGSAIGGDLTVAALEDKATVPIEVIRGAALPAWATASTLVIAVSYSGNTAETCAAYEEAKRRGCMRAAVTHGGILSNLAQEDRTPWCKVNAYPQPRLAVGDMTAAVMKYVAHACGISLGDAPVSIVDALNTLLPRIIPSVPTAQNQAKILAYALLDRVPVVAGGGVCAPVARRWKTQINENAKSICTAELFPELLHNTIEGLRNPLRTADDHVWILLEAPRDPAVPSAQIEKLAALLHTQGIKTERVDAPEGHLTAAQWWLLYLGDWVSYYLAILNGVNPMPVNTIQKFKTN